MSTIIAISRPVPSTTSQVAGPTRVAASRAATRVAAPATVAARSAAPTPSGVPAAARAPLPRTTLTPAAAESIAAKLEGFIPGGDPILALTALEVSAGESAVKGQRESVEAHRLIRIAKEEKRLEDFLKAFHAKHTSNIFEKIAIALAAIASVFSGGTTLAGTIGVVAATTVKAVALTAAISTAVTLAVKGALKYQASQAETRKLQSESNLEDAKQAFDNAVQAFAENVRQVQETIENYARIQQAQRQLQRATIPA